MSKRIRKQCTQKVKHSNFLALIVQCKNEPNVSEFVKYYLKQGVDRIYIVDDNSDKDTFKNINRKKVEIVHSDKKIHNLENCKEIYKQIQHTYEWIITVDMDEYITTKKHMHRTIRDELKTTFKNCMCVKVPWVMMAWNSIEHNPKSLLKTNVYRWNHDKKHVNKITNETKFRCRYNEIEVKCIFKPRFFDDIFHHHPMKPNCNVKVVESIQNTEHPLNSFYQNLREKDIKEGYLLCYHYRIVSNEHCLEKLKHSTWYKDFKLDQLNSFDYPEIKDTTMRQKN
jgi:hypothetical protein